MENDYKGEIIFPKIKNTSIPNRFLAIVETNKENDLKKIGETMQQTVGNEFKNIAASILNGFTIVKPNGFDEQVENYFTINWLFLPFDENNYEEQYREIESLMGAIKTVRVFKQFPDSEKGRKCSICGERNVKFYRLGKDETAEGVKNKKLFSKDVHIVKFKDYDPISLKYLKSDEGLCAFCFTKRCLDKSGLADYNPQFPSTSKIALFEAFKTLKEKDSSLTYLIDSDNYEPQGIFAIKNNRNLEDMSDTDRTNTEKIYKALEKNKISYSPYYAVMLFDGDSMGEWLSGSKIKDGILKEFHKELTEKLGEFSEEVRSTIKEPAGVTVYAGGEDFLGFFNLNYLLHNMKLLREKFDQTVNQSLKNSFYKNDSDNMTFSAGVVIAHFKTPLSEVLNWARKVEHEAKNIDDDKDAFAIAVLKHSGEIDKAVFKWKCDDIFVTDIIDEIAKEIKADKLSNTFIKRINQEMLKLMDNKGKYTEDPIIKTEFKRLLNRSCMRLNNESKEEEFEKRKRETVNKLFQQLYNIFLQSKSTGNFLSFLNIVDFIARQIRGEVSNED